jgi:hypothetical protein
MASSEPLYERYTLEVLILLGLTMYSVILTDGNRSIFTTPLG